VFTIHRPLAALAVLALTAPAAAFATTPAKPSAGAPLDLAGLLANLARTSPEVAAARAGIAAIASRRAAVRKLPEPTVGVAAQPLPVETRVGPQRLRVSVRQPIPWLSKFDRRAEAVDAAATAARRRLDATLARVRRRVRTPWADLAWLRTVAAVVKEQRELLVGLEPSVLARLRIGKAAYEDAQRLRLVIGELDERHKSLLDRQRAVAAEVRAAAGVSPSRRLAPAAFEADPLANKPIPTLADLLGALSRNPDVVAAEAAITAAQARVAAVDTARLPDITIGLDWVMVGEARMAGVADSGADALMVAAAVKLPVWRRAYDAEVGSARADVSRSCAAREVLLRKAEARLAKLLFALRDARRKHALYAEDLVPRAQSALQTALASYASARARFNDLIELQGKLLSFSIRLAAADAARVRALADLELLLGRPLAAALASRKETTP